MRSRTENPLHRWNLEPSQAVEVQHALREQLIHRWEAPSVERVAGVDVHFKGGKAQAAIAVLTFPGLELVAESVAVVDSEYPYIPGLLTFREGPAILAAWEGLQRQEPDLVLFDGQGSAHPRGIGLAAHLGLWLEIPTIGVAKSHLFGSYREPDLARGSTSVMRDERGRLGRPIGAVVRTRSGVRPLFVSPGHRIDVEAAVRFTLRCSPRCRLPEPIRWAHRLAGGGN